MAENLILILPFVLGAVIGSFLNVCIHRIPSGISIVSPPSSCPGCGTRIPFYYNVPVLGYLILRGRCASCRVSISARYPVVEAFTGLLSLFLFYRFGPTVDFLIYLAFVSSLVVITFIDLDLQIIPDSISLPGIPAGLLASFFLASPGVLDSVLGVVTGGGILFLIAAAYYYATGNEGMGGGDIKLLAMIGAFIGWKGVLFTLLFGSFLGAFIGVLLMVAFGRNSRYAIPFGPFLASGAALYLFFGNEIVIWYIMRAVGE